jgi:hypothetical protein
MAFGIKSIENFVTDQKLSLEEAEAIKQRAAAAEAEYSPGSGEFSGGKLEQVLGSTGRAQAFLDARERNLVRYGM